MEHQTGFNLNNAIENWRNQLAGLSVEDRHELETHLRETIGELRQRGLNNEESFWLSQRRIGQPQQLGEEFVKADPVKIWRERIFWMVLAYLVIELWGSAINCLYAITSFSVHPIERELLFTYFIDALHWAPLIVLAFLVAKGKAIPYFQKRFVYFNTRRKLVVTAGMWMLLTFSTRFLFLGRETLPTSFNFHDPFF